MKSGGVALEGARGEPESGLALKSRRRGGGRRRKPPNRKPRHLDGTRTPMRRETNACFPAVRGPNIPPRPVRENSPKPGFRLSARALAEMTVRLKIRGPGEPRKPKAGTPESKKNRLKNYPPFRGIFITPGVNWGDENVPYFAVNYLPIFVPRKLSWSLVRERRVGGLKPWRSGLVQSLFTPVSFEFIRSPTHHFPCRRSAIRSKKRRIGTKDGGLGSVQDCRAIYFKRSRIGDNTRVSTHPPYAPEPAREYCREGETKPCRKKSPEIG